MDGKVDSKLRSMGKIEARQEGEREALVASRRLFPSHQAAPRTFNRGFGATL